MNSLTLSPTWIPTRAHLLLGLLAATLVVASGWADRAQGIPFTLQMIPVLAIGLLFSPRQAMATVLGAAAFMALTISAPRIFFTGGFMLGWVLAVGLMAWLLRGQRDGSHQGFGALWRAVAAGSLGYGLTWLCGWAWLAYGAPQFGATKAWAVGVAPFLLGAPLKLAAAVAVAMALQPRLRRFQ